MAELTFTPYFIPLSTVAQWPTGNPKLTDHRTWYVPYAITLFVVVTVAVSVRLFAAYTKRIRSLGWDDLLIVGAWVWGLAFTATTVWGE